MENNNRLTPHPLEFPEQKIIDVDMEREVKKSFIEYSMSVIVSRALPDVRDGLKPVHRRILYDMNDRFEIEEITLMGVCTGICVLSNAMLAKATLPEVPVRVVEECCACVTPDSHKTAIDAMRLCQIEII